MSLFRGKSHRTSQGQNRDTPSITRRRVSAGLFATGLAPFSMTRAEPIFPGAQPLKLLVGFPAGGSQDNIGRILADRLAMHWKTPVIVENIAGAGSNIAFDRVAKGPADGSQILIVPPGLATNQFLYPKLAFDPVKDFTPLALVVTVPNLLCVRNSLPVNSMAELIAYAKANPGKLTFASPGTGTSAHLAGELLRKETGIELRHVPYKGSGPALTDLVAGRVDLMFDVYHSARGQVEQGKLKIIALTSETQPANIKGLPLLADTVRGFNVTSLFGLVVRAGTPKAVVDKIQSDTARVLNKPEVKARLEGLGLEIVGSTPEQFEAFVRAETAKWAQLIKAASIKIE
jgi:tripartite-type tricarboxylate transporter receptor subunit TctC